MYVKNVPRSTPLWKIYIADGFQNDCDELIKRCTQVKKLSYEKFCNIWKEMDFVCVFYGAHSGAEIAEFTDEAMLIAKSYMFAKTRNFEETVAGVFLVYALLNLQPFVGFTPLKIVNEDVESIEQIERVARSQRRYDLLYILGSMLIKGPCQYHVAHRERGLESTFKKYLEDDYATDFVVGSKGVFHRQSDEMAFLGELKTLSAEYTKAKLAVSDSTTLDRNLSYTNDNIPLLLENSFKALIFEHKKRAITESVNNESSDIPDPKQESTSMVSSIKGKAMKLSINPIRHLTGLQERDELENTVPQKSPSQNLKTRILSPRKRTKSRKRKVSKTPARIVFESSEESDSHMSLNDDSEDSITPIENSSDKININSTNKTNTDETIQIQLDTLPVFITASTEAEYEIEIIDQRNITIPDRDHNAKVKNVKKLKVCENTKNSNDEVRQTRSSVKRNKNKTNVAIKDEKSKESPVQMEAETSIKNPIKREKRDLKNNKVASSFQRMGLLDIVKVQGTKKK